MFASWRTLIPVVALAVCEACGSTTDTGVKLPVATVIVSPASVLLQVGEAYVLSATPFDATGAMIQGRTVSWSTSAGSILAVSSTGDLTAVAPGIATITAAVDGRSTAIDITVVPRIQRLSLSPGSSTIELGSTLQLNVALLDPGNAAVSATVPITWTVSVPARASVNSTGVLSTVQTGGIVVTATLTPATFAPISTTASVLIIPPVQVASVEILTNPLGLIVGQSRSLIALARDGAANPIIGRPFAWSSLVPFFATVGASDGLVTAFQPGTTEISATTGNVTAKSLVTVFQATPATGLGVGFGLNQYVLLPVGTFVMGSTDGNNDELPVRTITLTQPFRIQRTEVTRQQWLSIMGTLPPGQSGCELCPVSDVTFDQVQAFIAILNNANPGAGFRLPTEAQWEYAARGGSSGSSYADLQLIAEYGPTSDNHVWSVGLRDPNSNGLFDMLGNVSEWTADWYATSYNPGQTTDPIGPATGGRRVDRGGAYSSTSGAVRASYRAGVTSSTLIGFRLVRN